MSRLIDADELKKQAYKSGDWDKPLVVDVADIEDAPTIDQWHYPSKGEYPIEYGNYLVVLELEDSPNCCMRCIKFYNPKTKCFDTTCRVVAWMPLPDPPKEEA